MVIAQLVGIDIEQLQAYRGRQNRVCAPQTATEMGLAALLLLGTITAAIAVIMICSHGTGANLKLFFHSRH